VAASLAAENARLSAELDAERAAAAEAAGRLRALEADLAEARREAQFHTAQVRRCPNTPYLALCLSLSSPYLYHRPGAPLPQYSLSSPLSILI